MPLQNVIKAITKANHLSDDFAEPVQFEDAAGIKAARTVVMSIDVEVDRDQDGATEENIERVTCKFLTDEADPDVGGIANPQLNDFFRRTAENDPDPTNPFYFNGEILERGRHYIRAVFQRYKRTAQGHG